MIIDCHTHIHNEKMFKDYANRLKDNNFKALVLSWESYGNETALKFAESKKNLYFVGTVIINKNISGQLKAFEKLFKAKRMYGIKLYPGYKYFFPADRIIEPIAKLCILYDKPLIFHSGDVYDEEGSAVLKYSHPLHIDELAVKYPKLKIIISHFGFPYMLETATIVNKNPNVYTDISGTIEECCGQKELSDLVKHYAQDLKRVFAYYPGVKNKTMFGTDFFGIDTPLNQVGPYIKLSKKIFNKKEQDNLFFGLANKLFFS